MLESDKTAYLFSGTVISRTGEDTTILNNARITNAKNEEALWSINAKKLWLLPGSDFAITGAVLKVGEIPLLYIPAFYFAADDVIFHPVIGYRDREGGFVQTTTYILGRPKVDQAETSSITRILGNSKDMEKERQGLFLRSTGKKIVDPNTISLKALVDHYINLGTYIAAELYVPKIGILNQSDFAAGFGITRTVSQTYLGYTPFAPDYDGTSDWNKSNMFSLSVPFRYRMLMRGSATLQKLGGFSWDFPYYADPDVDNDFMNRAESMDWVNMMQQGASADEITTDNKIPPYQWSLKGNLNPSFPSFSPYVSRISVSNISTTISFRTIEDKEISQNSPGRFFFAPDKYSIYNFTGSITGNPFTAGEKSISSANKDILPADDILKGIGNPVSPWVDEDKTTEKEKSDEKLVPPVLTQRFDLPAAGNINFNIDYQISPTSASELQFLTPNWQTYDQVDWSDVQSVLTSFAGNGSLNFRMNHSRNLFTNVFTFSGRGTWRDYTYLNEDEITIVNPVTGEKERDEKRIATMRQQQYSQVNYSTSYSYDGTVRPLYQNEIFKNSNFNYTFTGSLVNSKRYTDGDGPELSPVWGAWVKQDLSAGKEILGLTGHKLTANAAADIMEKIQNVSVAIDLPPLDTLFYTNATMRYRISETNTNFRIKRQEQQEETTIPGEENKTFRWIYEPVYFTETLTFNSHSRFSFYMVLTPEENNEITTITSTLTLWSLGLSFKALKSNKFFFTANDPANPSGGGIWEQNDEAVLRPNELSIYYKRKFSNINIIKRYLSFSIDLDAALTYNLRQHTSSNFQFQMGFNLKITNFMDINLSATSENNVVFRYFKGLGMNSMTSMYMDAPQNNVFIDFFDSLNFFYETKRMRTGFKMRRFNLKATHYLGDWRAEFGIEMYPYFKQEDRKYQVAADISFIVQWKPISEIKTNLEYKGETDKWYKR
jgi:lipopolysaccharide assembly outer membrane protein LptD (OstA)